MIQTLDNCKLEAYVIKQLNYLFPDEDIIHELKMIVDEALLKIAYSFKHIALPYYQKEGKPFFNHLNADHYTVFIYYCSNLAYQDNNISLASKLFYLNKSLHAFHCMYDTKLPNIFIVAHGVGTVLGKAEYHDYLVVTQGCTIGANGKWEYPILGKYLILYPNSSILGSSTIGSNVVCANNSMVLNGSISDNTLVVGQHPDVEEKVLRENIFSQFFKD